MLKIRVPLPNSREVTSIAESYEMPTLQQVLQMPRCTSLSPFANCAVMVAIYRQCFDHINDWTQLSSYPFWDTYFRIDQLISNCRDNKFSQHLGMYGSASDRPLCLMIRIILAAVEIKLHETAITKVENEHLPVSISNEAVTKCQLGARVIEETVRTGQRLAGEELQIFQQSSHIFAWAMTKAIQTNLWMLHHRKDNVATLVDALRSLSLSTRELVDPRHLRPGLLEQVDAKISEAERLQKKRPIQALGGHF